MSFEDQELGDAWECPTCLQPFPPHHDYECGTCEAKASEHLRVTTMCKLLRETQRRENSLIVRLAAERALADRLAEALLSTLSSWMTSPDSEQAAKAIAAWKEVRDGS